MKPAPSAGKYVTGAKRGSIHEMTIGVSFPRD